MGCGGHGTRICEGPFLICPLSACFRLSGELLVVEGIYVWDWSWSWAGVHIGVATPKVAGDGWFHFDYWSMIVDRLLAVLW